MTGTGKTCAAGWITELYEKLPEKEEKTVTVEELVEKLLKLGIEPEQIAERLGVELEEDDAEV